MKIRKYNSMLLVLSLLLILLQNTFAIDYTISFSGSGASTSVDKVEVMNLTKGTTETIPAGGVLSLTSSPGFAPKGVAEFNNQVDNNQYIRIYPNPIQGKATLIFYSSQDGNTQINIYGIDGRKVISNDFDLKVGENTFQVALPKGAYIIKIVGNELSYTIKAISQTASENIPVINFIENKFSEVSVIQKSNTSINQSTYSPGDQLLYKATSGNYSTIVADVPTANKTVNFIFSECKDANGKYYTTVSIGAQTWMAENLNTTMYRTGSTITNVTSDYSWDGTSYGAYCDYNNNASNSSTYGKLYNWYAATDTRNLAPTGWHVPTDAEWTLLTNYLGGESVAGGKLKETGINHWDYPNTGATNQTGFTARSSGFRNYDGAFCNAGYPGGWWSSTASDATTAWNRYLYYSSSYMLSLTKEKECGFSIRCVKDVATIPTLTTTDVSTIMETSATAGGTITSDGWATITARGVCWSTTPLPTILNNKTIDGTALGLFTSSITGLISGTTYYLRAYAVNVIGTAYGNQVTFTAAKPLIGFSRYAITSDNNGDGLVNKGEAVSMQVYLKNNGTSTANKVRAIITTTSGYISGLTPTIVSGYYSNGNSYYDYIGKGIEGYDSNTKLSFTVSSTTPIGTVIPFSVSITDGVGNTWTDNFSVTVVGTGASIGFSQFAVTSDSNGDGLVNKGEAISLQVYLKNNGTSTANKVKATITSTSSYISGLTPIIASGYYSNGNSYYDYIGKGIEGYDSNTKLSFTVSSTTPIGTVIPFTVLITDESNNSWTDNFNVTIVSTGASIGFSKYTVTSDNNNDGLVNKGEAVSLQVFLINKGTSTANKVRATIASTSSFISGLTPTLASGYYSNGNSYYDYIGKEIEGYDSNTKLSFTVSSTTPIGTVIPFSMSIIDGVGNTWTDNFSVTVVATGASIGFSKYTVTSDNNNDGLVNKGEAISLQVYLKNNGTSGAIKVRAAITSTSSYISGLTPTTASNYYNNGSSYNDFISKGAEGFDSNTKLSFTVSSTTPLGTIIPFSISITDEANNSWSDTFSVTVLGTLPILTTSTTSAITGITATSGGTISGDGGTSVTARGVCWSTSSTPTILNNKTIDGTGIGAYTSSITGLIANTMYYIRAYATNLGGTSYGTQVSFTTTSMSVPTLNTNSVSAITQTTASCGGTITSDGGATVTARGVCWSTSANPTTLNSKTVDGTGIGSFTSSLSGLIANTTYYVRAYATNTGGTSYGTQVSFTTSSSIAYVIGTAYLGGKIAYLDASGIHGFVCALVDQSTNAIWSNGISITTNATNVTLETNGVYGITKSGGRRNTDAIIAAQGVGVSAAYICAALTTGGAAVGDWYLPSKGELNQIYLNKTVLGGFASAVYWSSSESSTNAWYCAFDTGGSATVTKTTSCYIRAIRAF